MYAGTGSRWEAPTTFVRQYTERSVGDGQDIIWNEEFPITSKGTGVVCTDKAGIHRHGYISSFLRVLYAPWTCVRSIRCCRTRRASR